ncbi:MAG: histidinol-phosphate transaminase [Erythrobacter sp.]|jgi:histidinol-phosphate aminotransferase|nr:histidinol-phosphate transaminase [Erythrobacter sp.]
MTSSKPTLKPWIAQLAPYKPGVAAAADGRALVKLSANENPLGTSPAALAALNEARTEAAIYPDPDARALRAAIGEVHALEPERIAVGTGSGEVLHCAVQAFAGLGDEVLASRYSFSLYPLIARKVGAEPILTPDAEYHASVDALLAGLSERTRVVLLDNPNNPTGTWISAAEVRRLHAGLPPHVLLVLDEAYGEYLPEGEQRTGFALAAKHENVLVTRTFSKAYGLAAERIGWAYGAPGLIDAINRLRGAFNVTLSGQRAAIAALGDQDFVRVSAEHNARVRGRFAGALAALGNHGIRVVPSEANFVLVEFAGSLGASEALRGIEAAGYAVRHLPGQGLPDHLRITIGHEADMDMIAQTIGALAKAHEAAG